MSENFSLKLPTSKSSTGEQPVAYRRGVQDFYGREFRVTPDVLIPRPETEMMVDAVLNLAGKAYLPGVRASKTRIAEKARILEVGTGSGCVAITLALELPKATVVACDVSEEALAVARENARRLGVLGEDASRVGQLEFLKSDLLEQVAGDFQVVVANLPYVDRSWEWLDREALGHEPELALYAGDGGCELIFRLMRQVTERTKSGKPKREEGQQGCYVVLEADPCQHDRVKKYAAELGWRHMETRGFILTFCTLQG